MYGAIAHWFSATTYRRGMSEMTFRGLGIWDLGIMTRVGVRKLGEIDGGLEQSRMG
jgi:hypothetical protein